MKQGTERLHILFFFFILFFTAVLIRLVNLQVLGHSLYQEAVNNQLNISQTLSPLRGEIFIQDLVDLKLHPVAINKKWKMVYANNRLIKDKEAVAQNLAPILDLEKEDLLKKLEKDNDPFEILSRKLADEKAELIKDLNLDGIKIQSETLRHYPFSAHLSHLIGFLGFAGYKRVGQYGIEEFYDQYLRGREGRISENPDLLASLKSLGGRSFLAPQNGSNFILTIDKNIQFLAEEKLDLLIKKWKAEKGSIIILEPKTGKIRALANFPVFDLNNYNLEKDISIFTNSAVSQMFEPGSVFKPITMAAAIDAGAVSPETKYEDRGQVAVADKIIKNFDEAAHGTRTMTEVLELSLNTGAVFAQKKLGQEKFLDYVEKFGFGRKTGIDVAGEVEGNINNLYSKREINFATAAFGQGIAVVPIQIASAISVIANRGELMKPYIVEKEIAADGREIVYEPVSLSRVLKEESALRVVSMMVSVVRKGFDKRGAVKGYFVAGKTGTAQIPDLKKGGYKEEFIHSYAGFAPAYEPKFLIFIKLDKPIGNRFAANTLSPVFGEMAQFLLNYFRVPPDEVEK